MKNLNEFIQSHKEELGINETEPVAKVTATKKSTTASKGITEDELNLIFNTLKQHFSKETKFSNADLKDFLEEWNLTGRQTPSRLKRLADENLLVKYETTPLTYSIR